MSFAETSGRGEDLPSLFAPVCRYGSAGVVVLFASMVAMLLARRAAGALTVGLSLGNLVLYATGLVAAAVVVRCFLEQRTAHTTSRVLISVAILLGLVAVWLPTASQEGLLILTLMVVAEEAWAWSRPRFHAAKPSAKIHGALQQAEPPETSLDARLPELIVNDPTLHQHLLRSHRANGGESITGWLRGHFIPGQRHLNLHVGFCPPLLAIPTCVAETIDGPPAEVKVAQVLHQGVRLELRLDAPAEQPEQVIVEFSAVSVSH